MLDKFFYNFFGAVDNAVAWLETFIVKLSSWCWTTRKNLLKKRRKIKR